MPGALPGTGDTHHSTGIADSGRNDHGHLANIPLKAQGPERDMVPWELSKLQAHGASLDGTACVPVPGAVSWASLP